MSAVPETKEAGPEAVAVAVDLRCTYCGEAFKAVSPAKCPKCGMQCSSDPVVIGTPRSGLFDSAFATTSIFFWAGTAIIGVFIVLAGLALCATIIGALLGIPLILLGICAIGSALTMIPVSLGWTEKKS